MDASGMFAPISWNGLAPHDVWLVEVALYRSLKVNGFLILLSTKSTS
jgi:hypothetical protein